MIKIRLTPHQVENLILNLVKKQENKEELVTALSGNQCNFDGSEYEMYLEKDPGNRILEFLSASENSGPENHSKDTTYYSNVSVESSAFSSPPSEMAEPESESNLLTKSGNPFLIKNEVGVTFFHECARRGDLSQIPSEFWTQDIWYAQDENGETFTHWAARFGHIDQIPERFHDPDLLLVDDSLGETMLHKAAFSGFLMQAPAFLLTEEFLLVENKYNQNCLHRAAYGANLGIIPVEFLTEENLAQCDQWGNSVASLAEKSGCLSDVQTMKMTADSQKKNPIAHQLDLFD